jgi:hypothetical protein
MIGATVVIGITHRGTKSDTYEQVFGIVRSVDATYGFEIELDGSRCGDTYWLPPQIDYFTPAEPGQYRLRSTGETVENPAFLATWTIEPPLA